MLCSQSDDLSQEDNQQILQQADIYDGSRREGEPVPFIFPSMLTVCMTNWPWYCKGICKHEFSLQHISVLEKGSMPVDSFPGLRPLVVVSALVFYISNCASCTRKIQDFSIFVR